MKEENEEKIKNSYGDRGGGGLGKGGGGRVLKGKCDEGKKAKKENEQKQ